MALATRQCHPAVTKGIYTVEGDTMKVAIYSNEKKQATEQPKDFEPAQGKTIATYRRKEGGK